MQDEISRSLAERRNWEFKELSRGLRSHGFQNLGIESQGSLRWRCSENSSGVQLKSQNAHVPDQGSHPRNKSKAVLDCFFFFFFFFFTP